MARRAGNLPEVIHRRYAGVIDDSETENNKKIEKTMGGEALPGGGCPGGVSASVPAPGTLEATSVSSAAWPAGVGLLTFSWPGPMDHSLRDDCLDQQTETAWALADDLEGVAWPTLSLPVDGVAASFYHRESEFGWVLAGTTEAGVHLGAYGRGMSAYGLGFAVVKDIAAYA